MTSNADNLFANLKQAQSKLDDARARLRDAADKKSILIDERLAAEDAYENALKEIRDAAR